jgi:hypothetical protein
MLYGLCVNTESVVEKEIDADNGVLSDNVVEMTTRSVDFDSFRLDSSMARQTCTERQSGQPTTSGLAQRRREVGI